MNGISVRLLNKAAIIKIGIIMKHHIRIFLITMLSIVSGCANIPKEEQLSDALVRHIKVTPQSKQLIVKEAIPFSYKMKQGSGFIRYNLKTNMEIIPGSYIAVAIGKDGTYYKNQGKGLKKYQLGLPTYIVGGIKIPNDPEKPIRAWSEYQLTIMSGNRMKIIRDPNVFYEYPVLDIDLKEFIEFDTE